MSLNAISRNSFPFAFRISSVFQAMSLFFEHRIFSRWTRTIVAFTRSIRTCSQACLFAQFMDSLPEDVDHPYMPILSPMAKQEAGYCVISSSLLMYVIDLVLMCPMNFWCWTSILSGVLQFTNWLKYHQPRISFLSTVTNLSNVSFTMPRVQS